MPRHPITLTVSTGRSGTTFLYRTFAQNFPSGCCISHELLHAMVAKPALYHRAFDPETKKRILAEPIIRDLLAQWEAHAEAGPVVDFGRTMCPLIPVFHDVLSDQLRVLVIHRHPLSAAASVAAMGAYTDYTHENYSLTPMHERVRFPHYAARWPRMSAFEKSLFRWLEMTAYGLELAKIVPPDRYMVVAFEDLIKPGPTLEAIATFLGLGVSALIVPHKEDNALKIHHRERYPVGKEWRNYLQYPEVLELGRQLGYNMEPDQAEQLMEKYQLPHGLLPYLRHVTGYWQLRSWAGTTLRKFGLREEYPDKAKMQRQMNGQLQLEDVRAR